MAQRPITVGELIDSLPMGGIFGNVSAIDRARLIADPPLVVADEVNSMFRIKLADGRNLNVRVVTTKPSH